MQEAAEAIKNFFKKLAKGIAKRWLPIILVTTTVIIIIAGSTYIIMKWTAKVVAEAALAFTSSVNIGTDGKVTTGITAKELWDQMKKAGYQVDKYLDNPEELAKLLKAELVTQLPDTRDNVEEEIDWEALKTSDDIQGIIKFKRHDSDGKEFYLTYTDPDTFDSYIKEYESSGSDNAKEFVLTHYTLKKRPKTSSSTITGERGQFTQTGSVEEQGYGQVYTTSTGITYKDFKQGDPAPWAGYTYQGADGSHSIGSYGCGLTSVADILSGLGLDKTPVNLADEMHYTTNTGYLSSLGVNAEYVSGNISAIEVEEILKSGKAIAMHYSGGSFFAGNAIYHFVAIVDTDGAGNFLVLNPGARESGWYSSSQIEDGNYERLEFDVSKAIKSSTSSSSTSNTSSIGSIKDITTDISDKIMKTTKAVEWPGKSLCLNWVDNVYESAGVTPERLYSARDAANAHVVSKDMSSIPIGAAVYGEGSGNDGHVGIYAGNGMVIDSNNGGIKTQTMEDWLKWQQKGSPNSWLGWGWEDGNKTRGTSSDSRSNTSNSNYTGILDSSQSGDGYDSVYTSSTGFVYKDFKQIRGSYATQSYWGGTIKNSGCGPTSAAILASGLQPDLNYSPADTAKIVTDQFGDESNAGTMQQLMDTLGMKSEVIYDPSAEEIQNQIKSGKVMIVSTVNPPSIFPNGSGHYVAAVDINENGQIFIMNPNAKSGADTGWYDAETVANGCNAIIMTDSGKVGVASVRGNNNYDNALDTAPGYQAVIATWKQVDKTTATDSATDTAAAASAFGVKIENGTTYTITTRNINYEEMVQPYTLSFDLIWSLLVIGQSKGFAMELADLAYGSELEVSIYDNLTITTDIDNWSYKEATSARIEGEVSYRASGVYAHRSVKHSHEYENGNPLKLVNGFINKTVVTQNNTVNSELTKAHTWIANYDIEYEYNKDDINKQNGQLKLENQQISNWKTASLSDDTCGLIDQKAAEVASDINAQYKRIAEAQATKDSKTQQEKETKAAMASSKANSISAGAVSRSDVSVITRMDRVEIVDNTTDIIEKRKYIAKTPTLVIKDDKTTEPNFVTLFNKAKYRQNKMNILSATRWLFEILEENEKTKNMAELMKYLLYKSTNTNYGVTEFNFKEFLFRKASSSKGSAGGALSVTESPISKEEFVQLVQSYSAAVANSGTQPFRDGAETVYDVCIQEHINPVLCAAESWAERNWVPLRRKLLGNWTLQWRSIW